MHILIAVLFMTVACVDSYDTGHAHLTVVFDPGLSNDQLTLPTVSEAPEKRSIGTEVIATINGQMVSWINEWPGQHSSVSSDAELSANPGSSVTPVTVATHKEDVTSSVSLVPFASSSASPSFSNWADYPSSGEYVIDGFGSSTTGKRVGSQDWDYIGNVGSPWGSNIIEIREDKASQYKHVIRFENENSKAWYVVVWNSYGPSGGLNGFWSPNKALSFSINPGQSIFVAIDNNSQGGWGAAEGDELPVNYVGEYASTWGEFDMSNSQNDGFSGWDVSCIIAELANMNIAGMQICNRDGGKCSSITQGAGAVVHAYTSADQGKNDKAVAQSAGPVRLIVKLGWSG
ncbi:unnamed protein product [Penicillium salamii]|nr:unnamed protein product [Penicillium salamii]CAG8198605.1 unnamed protein product [Penicillium salamii]CAG8383781.1 unnamed protein product [Penicillium salamii]CAG8402584.1 unnamed protein product [Penicillium salamii]CAG8691505.1 unnamed protein product [Penicillium salamii]